MKEYKTLLFDIDGTLLDFKKAEDYAMHKTFSDHHLELTSEIFEIYEEINSKLWKDFELGLIDKKTVVYTRFVKLFNKLGINEDGVTFEELFDVSPLLASRSGLNTSEETMEDIANKLSEVVSV